MLESLLEHNTGYFSIISNLEQRPWGKIFYNLDIPQHQDSNHVQCLRTNRRDLPKVLDEVEEFYRERGLVPRVKLNQFDQPQGIEEALLQRGYTVRPASYRILLWDCISTQPVMRPGITVEEVGAHNRAETLRILSGERSWGTPEMLKVIFAREFAHPDVQYYMVRKDEEPAAIGYLFYQGSRARVENVRTLPQFRGQGCAAALIKHIQAQYTSRGGEGLYLLAGDAVMGLYQKQGFKVLGEIEELNAFLPK